MSVEVSTDGPDRKPLPKQKAPGATFALHWESLLSRDYFLNVKLTGYDGRDDYFPYNGTNTPGRIDYDTDKAWVNQAIQEINHRHSVTLESSLSMFKDNLLGAGESHAFKFGLSMEHGNSSDNWTRNGGFTYYDDSSLCESEEEYYANPACGAQVITRGYGEYKTTPKYEGLALYAQDSIQWDRLTINPGLRYGSYQGGWQSGHGKSKVYDVDFIDPRLGFVWNIRGTPGPFSKPLGPLPRQDVHLSVRQGEIGKGTVPNQDCYWNPDTGQYDDCEIATVILARMGKVEPPLCRRNSVIFRTAARPGHDGWSGSHRP